MATRIYKDRKDATRLVHAKPSPVAAGIMVYYRDKDGHPVGRVLADTVEDFNERYELIPEKQAA